MQNVLRRHLNLVVLAAALLAQVVALAYQIKVDRHDGDSTRLLRLWAVNTVTPIERGLVDAGGFFTGIWRNYFYLHNVRAENEHLQDEVAHMRLQQIRMAEDAAQAQRLQALFHFKEQYISQTMAAQVIAGSGSELSRLVYIDKGSYDGVKADLPVVNATGVVGKIVRVFPTTSQVLEINDQSSGVGAILEKSRLQGILKGTPQGDTQLFYIMGDEKVEVGERVLTSGGDHIFPKGLPLGTVAGVSHGGEMFLNIRVKPAANLNRMEEVLVITKITEQETASAPEGTMRAADILAQRLPTVQPKAPEAQPGQPPAGAAGTQLAQPATGTPATKPPVAGATATKPAGGATVSTAKPGTATTAKPVTVKPITGTTAKPAAGTTPKPLTAATAKPATGTTPKPATGATAKPMPGSTVKTPAGTAARPTTGSTVKPPTATAAKPGSATAPRAAVTPKPGTTPTGGAPAAQRPKTPSVVQDTTVVHRPAAGGQTARPSGSANPANGNSTRPRSAPPKPAPPLVTPEVP